MLDLRPVVYPLVMLSGMAGLVYETVWVRQFEGIFGSTAAAVGAVTAAFMLGMAAGGALIGRLGDFARERLVVFAALEALVGGYGIASVGGFNIVENIFYSVGGGGPVLQFILAAVFLLFPTMLMGGTLPVLSRLFLDSQERVQAARGFGTANGASWRAAGASWRAAGAFGRAAGGLYAAGTLGAAAGAFVAGFYLLELLGAAGTLRVAGAVNLTVAAAAITIRFGAKSPSDPQPAPPHTSEAQAAEPPRTAAPLPAAEPPPGVIARLLLLAAFVLCGAALLGMEVVWTRLLSQFFRNSIYSFAGMLACLLAGLAAGGFLGTRLSGRTKSPRRLLACFQFLAGLATLATLYLFQWLGDLNRYRELVRSFGGFESFGGLALLEMTFAFCVVFPPTFLMGTAFPLMAAMSWRRPGRFGGYVGDVQLASTLGAVAGSLAMAFWLLPSGNGLMFCVLAAAAANGAAAILLLAARPALSGGRMRTAAVAFVTAGIILAWAHPGDLRFWRASDGDRELLFYREDAVASVAVVARDDGLVMKVNNTAGLGGTAGAALETRLGLMPPLMFGTPNRALVLGLGTGNTLMGLIAAGPKEVDCIELVPGVIEAAKEYFHKFQEEVPYEMRLNIRYGDARIWLAAEDRTYDLVLGDLFFPWQSTAGFLYTREHFERVKERLSPGGVYCQWVPLYQMHWEDFGVIGYTFSEVFDHTIVFLASGETDYPVAGLVGRREPFKLDPVAAQERIDFHPAARLIERLSLDDAMENLSLYIGDQWLFRARFPDPILNTADRPVVEFRSARVYEQQEVLGFNHFVQLAQPGFKENALSLLDREALEGEERSEIEMQMAAYSEGMREYLASHAYEVGARIIRSASGLPAGIGGGSEPEILSRMLDARVETGLRAFETAPKHRVLRGNLERIWRTMIQREELAVAANLMQIGCSRLPGDEELAYNWGLSYLLQEMYDEARVAFDRALDIRPDFFLARVHRAIALFCQGKHVQAREQLDEALADSGAAGRELLGRSPLTSGLVDAVLAGPAAAQKLASVPLEGPWGPLIARVLKEAGAEGVEPPR